MGRLQVLSIVGMCYLGNLGCNLALWVHKLFRNLQTINQFTATYPKLSHKNDDKMMSDWLEVRERLQSLR